MTEVLKATAQQFTNSSILITLSPSILAVTSPGGPGLDGIRMSPFWILSELRVMGVVVTTGAVRLQSCSQKVTTNKSKRSFLQAR